MEKHRKDIAGYWMLDRGDLFSFRKRDGTRIASTRRGSTRYRHSQITASLWGSVGRNCTVTACILCALQKLLQCELHHVPLLWSDSATKIFNEIWLEQVLELKEWACEYFLLPSPSQAFLKISVRGGLLMWLHCLCGLCDFFPPTSTVKDKVFLAWFV